MNETAVELLYGLVAVREVAATARFVAKAPENDTGEVAVSKNHALFSVNISRTPTCAVRKCLATVIPVVVTLKVCLVHDIHTIIVEHGIHLILSWIVAAANCIDVCLLHQLNVSEHGRNVYAATMERMGVLRVHSLEINAFAVDKHSLSATCGFHLNASETMLCSKCHLFVAIVEQRKFHRVQVWRFFAPEI